MCQLKEEPPPGYVIYEKDDYVIHEIDGEEHKVRPASRASSQTAEGSR